LRRDHIEYLACPTCAGTLILLRVDGERDGRVERGILGCTSCGAGFAVSGFVPRFVSQDNYTASFGYQWNLHASTQLDSRTGVAISRNRFFRETRWQADLTRQTILELGGGAGRFTEAAADTGAMVVSVDYSAAVDANVAANGARPNVLVVQGDIYALPVQRSSFDKVFCFGVLQHTPDVRQAFLALPPCLRPGGELVVDAYARDAWYMQLAKTRYWVRPLTRRVPAPILYRVVRGYVRVLWPVSSLIHRLVRRPTLARRLSQVLLLADYRGTLPLRSEDQFREWAVLDTFDMLSPRYDSPQSVADIESFFHDADLLCIEVRRTGDGIVARGRRSPAQVSEGAA
jgi:SAM-dependent methyltransferase